MLILHITGKFFLQKYFKVCESISNGKKKNLTEMISFSRRENPSEFVQNTLQKQKNTRLNLT